jgi:hypothetical protein
MIHPMDRKRNAIAGVSSMKWGWVFCAIAVTGLVSCGKQEASSGTEPGARATAAVNSQTPIETTYNIGDVDYGVKSTTQLAPESIELKGVTYNELETTRHELAMAEATVSLPRPENLWVISTARTPQGFRPGDSVRITQQLMIDGRQDPVAEQTFVWPKPDGSRAARELKIDVLPELDAVSNSVLLYTHVVIAWFPQRASESIDADTPPVSPQHVVEKVSNTLRITFQ